MVNGKMAVVVIVTAVVLTVPTPTSAQRAKVAVVDAVEGMVTVTRQAAESRSLGPKDEVLVHDRIVTASESTVRIRFAAEAIAVVREDSVMTISEELGRPVLRLDNGVLYYRGSRREDQRDEAQTILTPNAIARSAGGIVLQVDPASETVLVTTVCVLERNGFAAAPGGTEVEIPELNCVIINGGVLGRVFPLPTPIRIPLLSGSVPTSDADVEGLDIGEGHRPQGSRAKGTAFSRSS